MSPPVFVPLSYRAYDEDEMKRRAAECLADVRRRRTVRHFSDKPVPREVIEACLLAAGTAPSGANLQPWHFVVVSDPALKHRIRVAAEREEHEFYDHKAPQEWLSALAPLGTDEHKPFLDPAFSSTLRRRTSSVLHYLSGRLGLVSERSTERSSLFAQNQRARLDDDSVAVLGGSEGLYLWSIEAYCQLQRYS